MDANTVNTVFLHFRPFVFNSRWLEPFWVSLEASNYREFTVFLKCQCYAKMTGYLHEGKIQNQSNYLWMQDPILCGRYFVRHLTPLGRKVKGNCYMKTHIVAKEIWWEGNRRRRVQNLLLRCHRQVSTFDSKIDDKNWNKGKQRNESCLFRFRSPIWRRSIVVVSRKFLIC